MESNGKDNVRPVTTVKQPSRIFTNSKVVKESLGDAAVVVSPLSNDSTETPDVPTASKMDSINGGRNPMTYLKWIVRQIYTYGLLLIGVIFLSAVAVAILAGVSFGWQLGLMLAAWVFGG